MRSRMFTAPNRCDGSLGVGFVGDGQGLRQKARAFYLYFGLGAPGERPVRVAHGGGMV